MRTLIDTHVWLWMLTEPEKLGQLRAIVEDRTVELLVSAASVWEIAIKYSVGRLPLPMPVHEYVPRRILSTGVTPVAIEHPHALAVAGLPHHHRDPFDRVLIAQAQILRVPIATADRELGSYDVELILRDP